MMRNYFDLDTTINHFEQALNPLSDAEIKAHEAKGAFRYIPYRINAFLEQLQVAITARSILGKGLKFIDVGCGIGTKVLLAQLQGCEAYGLEINPKYVAVARRLLPDIGPFDTPKSRCLKRKRAVPRIIRGDALTFDYSPYDIIYFYCPQRKVSNGKGMMVSFEMQLEEQILKTATPGSVVIANLAAHPAFDGSEGAGWKKGCGTTRLGRERGVFLIESK